MSADNEWKLPWTGACRCGRVTFRVSAPPIGTMACHCRGCQRMTASAYSLSAIFPASGFEVTAGEPVIGGLHGDSRHFHCEYCKSWLFTRPAGMDDFVNVRATMLDDCAWFEPFAEMCTSEGLPWAKTGARHSFAGMPGMDELAPLAAEFAKSGARPR